MSETTDRQDVRAIMTRLKMLTDKGLQWDYCPLSPVGAWGNPHQLQHTTTVNGVRVLLTRNCIGDDVPKDGIALCAQLDHNGLRRGYLSEFCPKGLDWAEATALWDAVHNQVGGLSEWAAVREQVEGIGGKR